MKRLIAWFVHNSVAANLLMWIMLVGGVMALLTTHQEEFPNIDPEVVQITVPYLGAAPEEAEAGVCLRIEEAIDGLEGIDEMHAYAIEGMCAVNVLLADDADSSRSLNEIKSRVDGINSFPVETERPIVSKFLLSAGVLQVALAGNTDETTLKEMGQGIRDDIAAMSGISQVQLTYTRPYEISLEVSELALRRWGISLDQVANAVRRSSLDLPGGSIRTEAGEVLLRTNGQAYTGVEFGDVVVLTNPDGSRILLRDIATVVDGFKEGDVRARFNGTPAVVVKVARVGTEDIMAMAKSVQDYVAAKRATLPEGLTISVWMDESQQLRDRLDTLSSTAFSGLILVLLILTLFLRFRLAMWVAAGIPIAMAGTIALFPYYGISISSLTVMAFILVLGIVVDDAIVVGERVFSEEENGVDPINAAINGTHEVSVPVIFGVLTTMAAFLPLLIVPGTMGDFFGVVGYVVIIALFWSIIESQLILPSHLAHRRRNATPSPLVQRWLRFQDHFAGGLIRFSENRYRPVLQRALTWRYATGAVALGVLIIVVALIASGRVVFSFFPSIDGDRVYATLEMPQGIDVDDTALAAAQLERAARTLKAELEAGADADAPAVVRNILTSIGVRVDRGGGPTRPSGPGSSHYAEVAMELAPLEHRHGLSAKAIGNRWRELTGPITDAVELTFDAASFSAGDPINFELRGRDVDQLRAAAIELRAEMGRFDGVIDVHDSFRAGKQEIRLSLLPEARNYGLTLADVGRQVRQSFYGEEAQRVARGREDVRVMVRYPDAERRSISNLETMHIRTPDGQELPFLAVAQYELGRGFAMIRRVDGHRVVNVSADVERDKTSPEDVTRAITAKFMPELLKRYPDISFSLSGEQKERAKAMIGLAQAAILALFIIFALLAIPLRSYIQPLVIMSVIPFGAVGAIVGHYVMGWNLMFFSMLGIVALSGVVVNASLVLVDYINKQRAKGVDLMTAVTHAGVARFRPIVLTSATTFVGLIPLMATANPSTAFIVPMAISLAWGVLFATVITLLLVPSLYLIAEDVLALRRGLFGGGDQPDEQTPVPATAG